MINRSCSVRVDNLGKLYRIRGLRDSQKTAYRYATLRDLLSHQFGRIPQMVSQRSGGIPHKDRAHDQDFWALKDVSFKVTQGETVGIIGRNGAGKSTLLKLLSRITEPTTGRIGINGRVASLLEVGTGFHPELTGRENIFLNAVILGMTKREVRGKFDEIVAFAEVEMFLDTPVKRYSSGMYTRLAFAVAAHMEPEILVVDEVLAVGDAQFQKKCLDKMSEVGEGGRTVLFVSHNMPAVTRLCSRGVLLSDGQVIADGNASEVVAQYMSVGTDGGTVREWTPDTAPGENGLKIIRIGLHYDDGTLAPAVVSVSDKLHVRITCRVGHGGLKFRLAVNVFTQGTCAFAAVEPSEWERKNGDNISAVIVPANLLAEGEYAIGVSAFASRGAKMHYAVISEAIVFQVVDPMTSDSARGDYTERILGVVRPKLEWVRMCQSRETAGRAQ